MGQELRKPSLLNCIFAFFNCRRSLPDHLQYITWKAIPAYLWLPRWHNSPGRLKAFLYLSTLWPSLWAAEAGDNCAHLSRTSWFHRTERLGLSLYRRIVWTLVEPTCLLSPGSNIQHVCNVYQDMYLQGEPMNMGIKYDLKILYFIWIQWQSEHFTYLKRLSG